MSFRSSFLLRGSLITLAVTMSGGGPLAAQAQGITPATEEDGSAVITVIGTRGQPRTVASSPSPIDILQPEQLQTVGRQGLQEALNALLPSFNLPAMSGSGSAGVVRAAGLRGLQADQVLILVNGKRRHNSALLQSGSWTSSGSNPVDLDLIPASAIGRLDILRDGAAAQYGSDAISGVINVTLDQSKSGGRISGTLGQNYRGDGLAGQVNLSHGFALPNDGYLFLAADYRNQDDFTRALPVDRVGLAADGSFPVEAHEVVNFGYGNPKVEAGTLSFNAGMTVGGIDLYAFGTGSLKEGWKHGNFRQANANGNIVELYPDGASARAGLKQRDFQYTVGGSGDVAGWHVDLSSSFAHDRVRLYTANSLNPSMGPESPRDFYLGSQIFTQWTNNLDVTRGFDAGFLGQTQLSFGLEHRYEKWEITAGEPLSYFAGDYVYTSGPYAGQPPSRTTGVRGNTPDDVGAASRNVVAGYLEISAQPLDKLFLAGAVRHERYDDSAGSTTNYKVSARYELTPTLALRGTVSTGFRAPSLAQSVYQASSASAWQATTGGYTQYYFKVLMPTSDLAAQLGAKPLVPETSRNYSAGLTWQPAGNASLTVDAYRILIDNRIIMSSTITGSKVVALLEANGLVGYNGAQFYTNAVDTRTQGIDVVGEIKTNLGALGSVRWSAAYNHNETKIRSVDPLVAPDGTSYDVFGRTARGYLLHGNPKDKVILGADWSKGTWTITARSTYYGAVTQPGTTAATDRTFGGKWIADLDVTHDFGRGIKASVGANNLFNTYPDDGGVLSNTGFGAYGYISPFGFGGGYYYGRVSINF